MDPVAFYVFGFPVRWYALAYILGILGGCRLAKKKSKIIGGFDPNLIDMFVPYAVIGIIIGGRLGHVIFYESEYYIRNILEVFEIWKGGMSFHGGFIGIVVASYIFCRKYNIIFIKFCDIMAISSPIGIFLGRIANYINGELVGKVTNCVIGVKAEDDLLRHPCQLYEAATEGLLILLVLLYVSRKKNNPGYLAGSFCIMYSVARCLCEFFKEIDTDFNFAVYLKYGVTLGQLLSFPILFLGCFLLINSKRLVNSKII